MFPITYWSEVYASLVLKPLLSTQNILDPAQVPWITSNPWSNPDDDDKETLLTSCLAINWYHTSWWEPVSHVIVFWREPKKVPAPALHAGEILGVITVAFEQSSFMSCAKLFEANNRNARRGKKYVVFKSNFSFHQN